MVGWERIAGEVELDRPRIAVQYEFYVNPERPAIYEVVRYRVTSAARCARTRRGRWPARSCNGTGTGATSAASSAWPTGAGCAWHEMAKGGADYLREVPTLLRLYGAHNRSRAKRQPG